MLHCIRLLRMGKEIIEGKGVIVRRPDALELLNIRKGKYNLEEILVMAQNTIKELKSMDMKLQTKIDDNKVNEILLNIRNHE